MDKPSSALGGRAAVPIVAIEKNPMPTDTPHRPGTTVGDGVADSRASGTIRAMQGLKKEILLKLRPISSNVGTTPTSGS